jgi:rod shape-determining protein MreC
MSLLNTDFRLSCKLRTNGYFGSLSWDGRSDKFAILNEIPQHVTIGIGDTVETTSYSAIFPEGIPVGTVTGFEKSGGDFFRVRVKLSTDFRKLTYVTVVKNLRRDEQLQTEMTVK